MYVAIGVMGTAIIGAGTSLYINSQNQEAAEDAQNAASNAQNYAADRAYASSLLGIEAIYAGQGRAAEAAMAAAGMSADAIRYAADKSTAVQWRMYEQTRADQLPWLTAGTKALGRIEAKIAAGPGEFKADPGYQFRLSEGNKNVTANAAATGNLASGRTLKALTAFGQDYASNEYDKFINRFYQSFGPDQNLAGLGQNTATQLGQQGTQTANSIANNITSSGNALASVYTAQGSNLAQIYTNTGNALANTYANQGNILTNQGQNIANSILGNAGTVISGNTNTANAVTSAVNTGMTGLAQYYGMQGSGGGGNLYNSAISTNVAPTPYQTAYGSYSL